ncbi:MAG: N-6 DNA methylase [Akkermansiaceae bacterium]|nr:N-6 DNA methylase [Akkermansiaceae bacterium]
MDGELMIVLPAKITFGGGNAAALREYIESNYKIKEISALPDGLFTPYTSILTYLFVFSTGRTDEVVLRQYNSDAPIRKNSPCKKLVIENELLLFSDEFADLNGWNIDMAFSGEDEDMKSFASSPVKKLRLKDASTVFRGKAVNTKSESGNIAVINISNITDTGIDYETLFLESPVGIKMLQSLQRGTVVVKLTIEISLNWRCLCCRLKLKML